MMNGNHEIMNVESDFRFVTEQGVEGNFRFVTEQGVEEFKVCEERIPQWALGLGRGVAVPIVTGALSGVKMFTQEFGALRQTFWDSRTRCQDPKGFSARCQHQNVVLSVFAIVGD
ncbi:hypothetical protein Fmac_032544 [Flemingia macrophylla]|uniref:Uncharacterized protein n=1 Tax=Flemingia macrophylla TaxID=520843 RepID=A0ABD1L5N1_9FABA